MPKRADRDSDYSVRHGITGIGSFDEVDNENDDADDRKNGAPHMHRNEKEAMVTSVEHEFLAGGLVNDGLHSALAQRRSEEPADGGRQN